MAAPAAGLEAARAAVRAKVEARDHAWSDSNKFDSLVCVVVTSIVVLGN